MAKTADQVLKGLKTFKTMTKAVTLADLNGTNIIRHNQTASGEGLTLIEVDGDKPMETPLGYDTYKVENTLNEVDKLDMTFFSTTIKPVDLYCAFDMVACAIRKAEINYSEFLSKFKVKISADKVTVIGTDNFAIIECSVPGHSDIEEDMEFFIQPHLTPFGRLSDWKKAKTVEWIISDTGWVGLSVDGDIFIQKFTDTKYISDDNFERLINNAVDGEEVSYEYDRKYVIAQLQRSSKFSKESTILCEFDSEIKATYCNLLEDYTSGMAEDDDDNDNDKTIALLSPANLKKIIKCLSNSKDDTVEFKFHFRYENRNSGYTRPIIAKLSNVTMIVMPIRA